MSGYGVGTNHFDLDDGVAALEFVGSSTTPHPKGEVEVTDEDGNLAGIGYHDGGPGTEVECVYKLKSDTLNLNTLKLGPLAGNTEVITEITVETSNDDWPTITARGNISVTDGANMPKFTLPAITLNGKRQAQTMLFSIGATGRLTGSTLTATGEIHHLIGEDTTVAAMWFTGAKVEITGDAVEISGAVTWTPDAGYQQIQAPTAEKENIGWGTSSFSQSKFVEKDT